MKNKKIWYILFSICLFYFTSSSHGFYNYFIEYESNINAELLLSDPIVGPYTVPGITESITLDQVIKIGLLGDRDHISGDHAWMGALLAAREINERGGILMNGTQYYAGLVSEDTDEAEFVPDIFKGISVAENMIDFHDPHFIIGGYREESLSAYLNIVLDKKLIFLDTGEASDHFCQQVKSDYSKNKYFFRVMPINGTSIVTEMITYVINLANYLNTTCGGTVDKVAIIREDEDWTDGFSWLLNTYLPLYGLTVVREIEFPYTATSTDFATYWQDIETAGAQIVISLILNYPKNSSILMAQQYEAIKPQCLIVAGSPYSQIYTYWDDTNGKCQYEIIYHALYNTSKTPLTIPFLNKFVKEYDTEPCYPGTGSYDAVRLLVNATMESQSFDSDIIVKTLEKFNKSNSFPGPAGNIAFLKKTHDLLRRWPYSTGLFCQWKYIDGKKDVLSTGNFIYPDSISTGSLRLPPWGINGLLKIPLGPPKDFTLNGPPIDDDGAIELSWTPSDGAENYSVYMFNKPITHINKSLKRIAYQNTESSFPIAGLKQGEYYFRVVAYNRTGETMSSNYVHTTILGPGNFNLIDDAGDPDSDGDFNLIWTDSSRVENYSVYQHSRAITKINGSLNLLAYQNAVSPFLITGMGNGEYYFVVVAYNDLGNTTSNCRRVSVRLSPEGPDTITMSIILILSISSLVGIAYIVWRKAIKAKYPKHKEKIDHKKPKHK